MRDFLHRISVPRWNPNDDGTCSLKFALARKATIALNTRRFLNSIFFRFCRFSQLVHPLLDIHMASRACADRTTGMFDIDAVIDCDFEQRFALAAHQIPLSSIGASQAGRIFQNKFHMNNGRSVFMSVALEMHGAKCRHFQQGRAVRMIAS